MWSTTDRQDFLDFAKDNLTSDSGTTTFGENFDAAINDEIASGLSISEYIMKAPIRERNQKIRDLSNSDPDVAQFRKVTIDPTTGYPTSEFDYEAATNYLIERGDEGFQSTAELNEQVSDSVKQADAYRKHVNDASSGMGVVGDFVGAMSTQMAEPVNYVAVIPGLGQASSLALRTGVGATEAAVGAALVAPTIKDWKNENDIDYTTKDMYTDIGLSAAFGGALTGVVGAVGDRIRALKAKKSTATGDEAEAYEAAEQMMREFETEVDAAQVIPEELRPMTAKESVDSVDDLAKAFVRSEDSVTAPDSTSPDVDDAKYVEMAEQSLGVKRERPETPEGVDVDTDAPDVITLDAEKFDFDVDGVNAAKIVQDSDIQVKRLEKAMNCMLGG